MIPDGYDRNIQETETSYLLQDLIESKELEKWQRYFCEMTNVFACCVDSKGVPVTKFSGNPNEVERILKAVDMEQLQNMLRRVSESTLEDQAIENGSYPNLRLAVVTIREGGKPVISWLICGVLSDVSKTEDHMGPLLLGYQSVLTEREFDRSVDLIRDISSELINYRVTLMDTEAKYKKSRYSEKEMAANLKRMEALTEVIHLLGYDAPLEEVIARMLSSAGKFLNIGASAVCRIQAEGESMQIVTRWCNKGEEWIYNEEDKQKTPFFLQTEKTLIISDSAHLKQEEKEEMEALGVKSVIAFPVIIDGSVYMHVCFMERKHERNWEIEEIKFLNDSVKILQSILARRIRKHAMIDSHTSIEAILDNVGGAIYVKDLVTDTALFANKRMRHVFDQEIKDGSIYRILEQNMDSESGASEIFVERQGKWYDFYYTKVKWIDGSSVVLCAFYDETEKKVYQRKIEQQANIDYLTGLNNRMCCERDLIRYIEEAEKTGKAGALLYLDLDDFKHINDGLGHQYGDVLLKAIAHDLQRIDGIENTCYRMGGDEFIIIVPPQRYGILDRVVDDIKAIFEKSWFLKNSDYYCTMSMGIVVFRNTKEAVHELIKKADIAMYESKKTGKNRVTRYSREIDLKSGKRLDMEKNMREATAKGYNEFEVYFQPIIDVQKEGLPCTGAEALIRWNSTKLGFIPPSEFIPLAEYLGLINPIGNYVLREACKYCKVWNDSGYPDYKVNVNLSVVQLLQNDIVEKVEAIIGETGICAHNLTLEVTESLAINDMERMRGVLQGIKKLGVRIALDDFGTGYSSLNHIRELPFDVIKVDQSFIRNLETDVYAKSFIKMVAELAEAIDVNLCVEGVETKGQFDVISGMRVSLMQGYYFDKPMQRAEFERKYTPKLHQTGKGKKEDEISAAGTI